MVRSMPGHGRLMTRNPPEPAGTGLPSIVDDFGNDAGEGRVAEPGLVAMAPGSGEIMMCPVSVCHQVSTIGQRSRPMTSRYHIQASGLIGSPTRAEQAQADHVVLAAAIARPSCMKARMAVGAV